MVDVVRAPSRRARIWGRALAMTALVGASTGCSLILDFDKQAASATPDSALTDTACMAYEPNDNPASAMAIPAGDLDAAICGGGETDYFKITVDGTQSVLARITFMNRGGAGDIDLRLLSSTGASVIDESRTSENSEEVDCPGGLQCTGALPAGDYLLQVLGFNATVTSAYSLHLELGAAPIDASVL
jgi:hypothetical protein